jgi:hypothetical protein
MIDLSHFKFRVCEKVEGLGGTPRKLLFALCFVYYDICQCFIIVFSGGVKWLRFLLLYFFFLHVHFPFYYLIMQQGLQFK